MDPWMYSKSDEVYIESLGISICFVVQGEVGMGGPLIGTINVRSDNGDVFVLNDRAGIPFVVNAEHKYVAFPVWNFSNKQQICLFDLVRQSGHLHPQEYRVLNLVSADSNVVEGVDSPKYRSVPVRVRREELESGERIAAVYVNETPNSSRNAP